MPDKLGASRHPVDYIYPENVQKVTQINEMLLDDIFVSSLYGLLTISVNTIKRLRP